MFTKQEEKRNKVLMLVFATVFFLIAFITQGQVKLHRFSDVTDGKRYSAKVTVKPLEFQLLNDYKDTVSLWIIADSLSHPAYSIMLYSEYTEGFPAPNKGIKLWYMDGTTDEFVVFEEYKNIRGIKYNIVGNSLSNLFHKEVLAIDFKTALYCEGIKEKKYFINFSKVYNK